MRVKIFKTYPSVWFWIDRCIQCNFCVSSPVFFSRYIEKWCSRRKEMKIENFAFFHVEKRGIIWRDSTGRSRSHHRTLTIAIDQLWDEKWAKKKNIWKKQNEEINNNKTVSNVKLNEIMFGVSKRKKSDFFRICEYKENWLHWQWDCFIMPKQSWKKILIPIFALPFSFRNENFPKTKWQFFFSFFFLSTIANSFILIFRSIVNLYAYDV